MCLVKSCCQKLVGTISGNLILKTKICGVNLDFASATGIRTSNSELKLRRQANAHQQFVTAYRQASRLGVPVAAPITLARTNTAVFNPGYSRRRALILRLANSSKEKAELQQEM